MSYSPNSDPCARYLALLDEVVDGALVGEAQEFAAAHGSACAHCAEALDRRAALRAALSRLRSSRVGAPPALEVALARAADSGEFVRLSLLHLAQVPAPPALDARVLDPAVLLGKRPLAPIRRFAAAAARIAAGLLFGVGGAYFAIRLLGREQPAPTFELVRVTPADVPESLRSTLEFLSGDLPGGRKG